MKQRKTFYDWLTHGYLLVIRDEENFEERLSVRVNYSKIIVVVFGLFLLLLTPTYFASLWLQDMSLLQEDPSTVRGKLIKLNNKVDSLEILSDRRAAYIKNIRNILRGDVEYSDDQKKADSSIRKNNLAGLDKIDSVDDAFREEFESADENWRSVRKLGSEELNELVFFTPISGIITRRYEADKKHFGIDIVAKKNEPIKCIADGTVVLASWTQDSGHVISVQHKNELISFYKHNSVLLKKVGDIVKAGEAVAIIGNSGELTDGPHLHFELWHQGNPVNPEDYISF